MGVVGRWWRGLGAVLVVAVFVPPVALMVSASLRAPGQAPPDSPTFLPETIDGVAFGQAVEMGRLLPAAMNSLIVAAVVVPVSVLVAALAGFGMTLLPRRGLVAVVVASMVALMVPVTALLVPRLALFRGLGVTDTLVPLMAPALLATSPLYPLVFFLAFRAVPTELYEAARLAGCSVWGLWWRVGMPLVRPVTVGISALVFAASWANVLDPLVYLYRRELFTLPVALRSLSTVDAGDYPIYLAGAVLATIPAVVVLAVAQAAVRRTIR